MEKHDDPTQAYDYTVTAGGSSKPYMQGAVIEILSDTTIIAREVGRAYAVKQLYAIIADNFGNAVTDEILLSGALFGDENIYYREPMQEDVDNENDPLIVLENGKLTAKNYDPSLVGAMWAPYTYGEKGTENSFAGATADWAEKSAGVQYKLNLPEAYADRAYEILKLVQSLQDDAAAQVAALNKMNENYEALGTLDKTKLGAMNGVIGVTDMTPGDDTETDAKNLELRQYFSGVVSNLIANSLDSNNYLKIYNILTAYNSTTGGLKYYYDNSESVINEINVLSGYLNEMVADDEKIVALEILTKAAGYPEYAERIVNLEAAMAQVKEDLVAPNAMINLNSDKLATLVKALQADGEATEPVKAVPYVLSKTLMVADSSIYYITVNVSANGKSDTLYSNRIEGGNGASVNIADLQAQIDAFVASAINGEGSVDKVPYYTLTADTKLESIDPVLTGKVTVNYTYTPTDYTVIVNGVENTINVNNLYVNLPKSNNEDEEYIYIIDGVENDAGDYGFTLKQLDELFVDGKYTVERKVIDLVDDKLVALVDALNAAAPDGDHYDLDDERTGIVANISASANVAESIAM
ncbi:MAG: hypothetical protein J6K33_10075, partial [Alistipes sp.]|nr:hypothetical protein [Alistipes sp.]